MNKWRRQQKIVITKNTQLKKAKQSTTTKHKRRVSTTKKNPSLKKTNEATKALKQIVKTMNQLPDNHYVLRYPDPTRAYYTYEQGDKWEETTNDEYQHKRDFIQWNDNQLYNMEHYDGLTVEMEANYQEALATSQAEMKPDKEEEGIKPEHGNIKLTTEYAKTESLNQLNTTDNKTQPLEEAASTKEQAEGSSSVEPEWGRFTKQNEKEIEEDDHTWI
jgi:hypothetical protein